MKHLKKFNESWKDKANRLHEICEEILIDMIDDGFEVKIVNFKNQDAIAIINTGKKFYDWQTIKDKIISLFTLLEEDYVLGEIKMRFERSDIITFNIEDFTGSNSERYDQYIKYKTIEFIEILIGRKKR